MATKKTKGNGAAAAPYEFKIKVDDRVKFIRNTHSEFTIERELHGLEGVVTNREITDSVPAICIKFDGKAGAAWVHPDDCELLLSAGNERAVEEPGDHETASVQTAAASTAAVPSEPFDMGTVSRDCPCKLPDDVLIAKGKELGGLELEEEPINNRLAREKELAKNMLAGIQARRDQLLEQLRDGTEMRPVTCKWIGDPAHGLKRLVRTDMQPDQDGYVVEEHTLERHELQAAMDFDGDDDGDLGDDIEPELGGSDDASDGDSASASAQH
jgi:hypothetical protein